MYWDILWYLIWLFCVPIHFKNHWNLFSDIYHLCKSVCNPQFQALAAVRENLFENIWGHLMVPYMAVLCAHSHWIYIVYLRMYRGLLWYGIWLHCVPIHFKNHWNLFSDIYHLCKSVFCNPHFPELATIRENLFENV